MTVQQALGIAALAALIIFNSACGSAVRYSSAGAGSSGELGNTASAREPSGDTEETKDDVSSGSTLRGIASYYADKFHGRLTANGERFDQNKLTAAHRTLPFGTRVRVRNLRNDKVVVVRINDRGPFVDNRIIDLSRAAAEALEMIRDGVVPVEVTLL